MNEGVEKVRMRRHARTEHPVERKDDRKLDKQDQNAREGVEFVLFVERHHPHPLLLLVFDLLAKLFHLGLELLHAQLCLGRLLGQWVENKTHHKGEDDGREPQIVAGEDVGEANEAVVEGLDEDGCVEYMKHGDKILNPKQTRIPKPQNQDVLKLAF